MATMNVYDLVDVGQLNQFVRSLDFDALTLSRFLPNNSYDRTTFRVLTNQRDQQAAARYLAFDAEAPIGGRPGLVERMGAMPPIKQKSPLTEQDQYQLEQLAGVVSNPLVASVFSDAALRARAIMQRFELARGQVLSQGQLTINEGQLHLTVDYGVPGGQMDVAPLGALWSNLAASVPLTDLIAWRDAYVAATGEEPGTILTSSTVASLLQRNTEIIDATAPDRSRVTREDVNSLLASEGLPPLTIYDSQYKNVGGTKVRAIPANRVIFLPSNPSDLGETQLGRTRESVELATAGVNLADAGGLPGLVVATMKSWDPIVIWTKAAAIGLPVLHSPELLFSAVVTA